MHATLGADAYPVAYGEVTRNSYLSANLNAVAYGCTSSYAHLPCKDAMLANLYVVSNLAEIVQFGTCPDDGCADHRTIYAAIGSNFDLVTKNDLTDMMNFDQSFFG